MSARERARRAEATASFRTEGALCDAFAAQARCEGYAVHAECSGWDLLLVCRSSGTQVGVQAKLRATIDVLAQALGYGQSGEGPDHHAVLVPVAMHGFEKVARALRLLVFDAKALRGDGGIREAAARAVYWEHATRAWTPPVEVVGFGGGRPGPKQLTPWKIGACRLCALLRRRGHLTREDFRGERISVGWWIDAAGTRSPVLRAERVGRGWRYVRTGAPLPDERWPEVVNALFDEQDGVPRRRRL
jgi:hypothetical protein